MFKKGFYLFILLGFIGPLWSQIPSFLNRQSENSPLSFSWQRIGKNIEFQVQLSRGYGLKRAAAYSFVKMYKVYSNGKKHLIYKKGFSGSVARKDKSYFSEVKPFTIKPWQRRYAKFLIAQVEILYCHFDKGICYQKTTSKRYQIR